MTTEELVYPNGIPEGGTGPGEAFTINAAAQWLSKHKEQEKSPEFYVPGTYGLDWSLSKDPTDLKKLRWGVIHRPEGVMTAEEKEHLKQVERLYLLRYTQMDGQKPREYEYLEGKTYTDFLTNNGATPGKVAPAAFPYYLVIVGSPDHIPWKFQQDLDGEYGVGRIWFDDLSDCSRYIDHLLEYEDLNTIIPQAGKELLLVGSQNQGDQSTLESAEKLIRPLYTWALSPDQDQGFSASLLLDDLPGQAAKRLNLLKRLGGKELDDTDRPRPALLFTASHGLENFHNPLSHGALILNDWPGKGNPASVTHCLAGNDIPATDLRGVIAFSFACFSAGTPRIADWNHPSFEIPVEELAKKSFVSYLPQKMLANGLLAFIGHVSRAWSYSFKDLNLLVSRPEWFTGSLYALASGVPAGFALDGINRGTADLSSSVADQLEHPENHPDLVQVTRTWLARNDGRGYVVLGDPYARLLPERLI